MDWTRYRSPTWDELIGRDGAPHPAALPLITYLSGLTRRELAERQLAANVNARVMGVTFTVYSEGRNVDRTLPFDLIPRVIARREWERTAAGLRQRIQALNLFIGDIYGDQKIIKDRVFPRVPAEGLGEFPRAVRGREAYRWACGRTSAARTWYAMATARCMRWRTTCAFPAACPT